RWTCLRSFICLASIYVTVARAVYPPFSFTDTPRPETSTLSLHDALPISGKPAELMDAFGLRARDIVAAATRLLDRKRVAAATMSDRKSTRLNSSHLGISYAVFCLKKKNTQNAYLTVISC